MNDATITNVSPDTPAVPTNVSKRKAVARGVMDSAQALIRGEELAYMAVDADIAVAEALVLCKDNKARLALRTGYVTGYVAARKAMNRPVTPHQAAVHFDYLARKHAPGTSRKAKSNGKKKGRKAKERAQVTQGDAARFNVAALAYIEKQQAKAAQSGDDEMLAVLGRIAALLAGQKTK